MTEAPKTYGWCPGALRPMMSGDGLVVRIRPPLGRLTQAQAHGVATLATQFGNGLLDVSTRANLQMRGIQEHHHTELICALRELGLVDATPQEEARRNVILTPFWQTQDLTHRIASNISSTLQENATLLLPAKFGFAIDCGPHPVLRETSADIRIEQGSDGLIVIADGADYGKITTAATAASDAVDLAQWFLKHGGAPNRRGRMRTLTARRALPPEHVATLGTPAPQPRPGPMTTGVLAALEFGQITAHTLAQLAQIGAIRLTPWRMLLIETTRDMSHIPGLILDATDPRLHVSACTGAPGCLQAHADTRALARALAPFVPNGQILHISGCAKGCAHPQPVFRTLTACAPNSFNVIANGCASDTPALSAVSSEQLIASPPLWTKDL